MLFTEKIKDNKAFMRCYQKGRFVASDIIVAYFVANNCPYNKIGITAGKKQGNAVQRNRIKRIIRAAYQLNEEKFPIGFDIVFVGRNNICEKTSKDIESFFNVRLISEMNKISSKKEKKGFYNKNKNGKKQSHK